MKAAYPHNREMPSYNSHSYSYSLCFDIVIQYHSVELYLDFSCKDRPVREPNSLFSGVGASDIQGLRQSQ